jgi:hypothetical protein
MYWHEHLCICINIYVLAWKFMYWHENLCIGMKINVLAWKLMYWHENSCIDIIRQAFAQQVQFPQMWIV